jgi:hypothetical protein
MNFPASALSCFFKREISLVSESVAAQHQTSCYERAIDVKTRLLVSEPCSHPRCDEHNDSTT